jgi:hypothetical protein
MNALSTWNGGVIIISHDERFITNVGKEVRAGPLDQVPSGLINLLIRSYGCVATAPSASLWAMYRLTRLACVSLLSCLCEDAEILPAEPYCQQCQITTLSVLSSTFITLHFGDSLEPKKVIYDSSWLLFLYTSV